MSEEILAFSTEHLDNCANLYLEAFNCEPWDENWTFENARMRLWETLNTPGFAGFVLQSQEILGFILGYREQWYDGSKHFFVKDICVRPNRQRQGIGSKLLSQLMTALTTMNVSRIFLLTLEGQTEAFYIKNGYQKSPRIIVMSQQL